MRRSTLLCLAGMLVIALGLMVGPSDVLAAYGNYTTTIKTGGLAQPAKAAVDVNGDLYVTDAVNKKVKKFDKNGNYVSGFSLSVSGAPVGIAVNSANIFVGDDTNNCVWIYNKSTGALADLSGTGSSHKLGGASGAALSMPNTVTVAPSGHIFAIDGDSDKIYIFNADGTSNYSFGTGDITNSSGTTIRTYYPSGLAMADSTASGNNITQNFFLGDQGNYRVQKLYYIYDKVTKAISTYPTFLQNVGLTPGTVGDGFGKFIRISDLSWDSNRQRLAVADSLQMVVQLFDVSGNSLNMAFNYSSPNVLGHLNIPTGVVIDNAFQRAYVVNNQDDSIAVFTTAEGAAPTISVDSPASALTLEFATDNPYTVNYTAGDTDSTATLYLFYDTDNTWSGGNKSITPGTGEGLLTTVSIPMQSPTAATYTWQVMRMTPGTYYVRGFIVDANGNSSESYSLGSVYIKDTDGDGLNDMFERTYSGSATGLNPTDDLDNDGLTSLQEQVYGTDPTKADTDGGGVRDGVEIAMGTDPTSGHGTDDLTSTPSLVGIFWSIEPGANWKTWHAIKNTDPDNKAYVDVTFYGTAGGTAIATKSVEVPPNGTVIVDPASYPDVKGSIVIGTDGNEYRCILSHTASAANQPITGGSWATYWALTGSNVGRGSAWVDGASYLSCNLSGNADARVAGGRCVGYATQEKWNLTTLSALDYCYSSEMGTPSDAATEIYNSYWSCTPNVWDTYVVVKNVSSNQLSLQAALYSTTGSLLTTKNKAVFAPKSVWVFSPKSWVSSTTYPTGNCIVKVTSGSGTISGYGGQMYLNQSNNTIIDYGYTALLSTPANLISGIGNGGVAPHWIVGSNVFVVGTDGKDYRLTATHTSSANDQPITGVNWATYWADAASTGRGSAWASGYNYICNNTDTYMTFNNPTGTLATALSINYYGVDGTLLATKTTNINPKSSKAITPHTVSPQIGYNIPFGSVEYTITGGDGGFIGYDGEMQYNSNSAAITDSGISVNLSQKNNPATVLYAPYIRKNMDGWDTEMYIRNPNSSAVTADIYYYNMSGTQIRHDTASVPAKGLTTVRTKDIDLGGATEASVKIVATGGGLQGFFCAKRNDPITKNPDGSDMYEGNFGVNFMK